MFLANIRKISFFFFFDENFFFSLFFFFFFCNENAQSRNSSIVTVQRRLCQALKSVLEVFTCIKKRMFLRFAHTSQRKNASVLLNHSQVILKSRFWFLKRSVFLCVFM